MSNAQVSKAGAKPQPRPKPIMRNLHLNQTVKNVYVAVGLSAASALLFYVLHNRRRRNIYADFHANYDAEKSFNRMMEGGYLSSCPPGGGDK